jgi:hypothetical protein
MKRKIKLIESLPFLYPISDSHAGLVVPQNNLTRKRSDLEDMLSRQNQRRSLLSNLRQEMTRYVAFIFKKYFYIRSMLN